MNDFIIPSEDNNGSIYSFQFIPVEDIKAMPEPSSSHTITESAISLQSGKQWFTGYGTLNKKGLKIDSVRSDHGTVHNVRLLLSYPRGSEENDALFEDMDHQRFVLIVTDNNGQRRIIGNKNESVMFIADYDTGNSFENYNGYSIAFTGTFISRPPYLV